MNRNLNTITDLSSFFKELFDKYPKIKSVEWSQKYVSFNEEEEFPFRNNIDYSGYKINDDVWIDCFLAEKERSFKFFFERERKDLKTGIFAKCSLHDITYEDYVYIYKFITNTLASFSINELTEKFGKNCVRVENVDGVINFTAIKKIVD